MHPNWWPGLLASSYVSEALCHIKKSQMESFYLQCPLGAANLYLGRVEAASKTLFHSFNSVAMAQSLSEKEKDLYIQTGKQMHFTECNQNMFLFIQTV